MAGDPVSIFVSYSRKDENLMRELKKHLDSLKLEGWLSDDWYDGFLFPGEEWDHKIKQHLVLQLSPSRLSDWGSTEIFSSLPV